MAPSSPRPSNRWHRLVEQYTPDGALGRFLLAMATGTGALFAFYLAVVGVVVHNVFGLLLTAGAGVVLLLTVAITISALWPVYLSLIGNLESADEYGSGTANAPSTFREGRDSDDSVEMLKRQYAAGNVSESEFERRLGTLLNVEDYEQLGIADGGENADREMEFE